MKHFTVTVRTRASITIYSAIAASSNLAYEAFADLFGDTPYGITVIPAPVRV